MMREDTTEISKIRTFVHERFAAEVGLSSTELSEENLTLADVVRCSPNITNSVDLMECFARTSNAVRREYGIRVRLPAYPGNTTIKTLVDSFIEQVELELTKEARA